MTEIWKTVHLTELYDTYEVSNLGRIRSLKYRNGWGTFDRKEPLVLTPSFVNGYKVITFRYSGKKVLQYVHRLVLFAFFGPPPFENYECAHLDGVRSNSRLENLQWVSPLENASHRRIHGTTHNQNGELNASAKLKNVDVVEMREMKKNGHHTNNIALRFKINPRTARAIIAKESWKHI